MIWKRTLKPGGHVDVRREVRDINLVHGADRALDRPAVVQAEPHVDLELGVFHVQARVLLAQQQLGPLRADFPNDLCNTQSFRNHA